MKTMNQIKNFKIGILSMALFITLGLVSCRENNVDAREGNISVPSDADGYLIAGRTSIDGVSPAFDLCQAAFSNTPGVAGSLVDVGAIKCNNTALTKSTLNAYILAFPNYTAGTLKWEVAGGNGFGAFTKDGLTFPSRPVLTSSDNVTKSGYTITHTAVTGADKVYYTIVPSADPSKLTLKSASGSSTSMTFSASDLNRLTAGEDVGFTVTAYKLTTETLGGKKIYIQISSQDMRIGTTVN